jgi:hypothetical protein
MWRSNALFVAFLLTYAIAFYFSTIASWCVLAAWAILFCYLRMPRCPHCRSLSMRMTNWVKTYPGPEGTGIYYLCNGCNRRWFCSRKGEWVDASVQKHAWAFVPKK